MPMWKELKRYHIINLEKSHAHRDELKVKEEPESKKKIKMEKTI